MKTETYQRLLSDLCGTLHSDAWHASPVRFYRAIARSRDVSMQLKEKAALAIQWGTGHCGEHADVSFSLITDLIADPGSKVKVAVKSGNANIDHNFVVVDLDPQAIVKTKTSTDNARVKDRKSDPGVNKEIDLWNLKDAIAKTSRPGFVLDPYLDLSVMKPEAKELLTAINNKGTNFLDFSGVTPSTLLASIVVEDHTAKSHAKRSLIHPNV
jgi:hypothetical protein